MAKLVAADSTLVLNKNEAIYGSQLAQIKLTLKSGDNHLATGKYKYTVCTWSENTGTIGTNITVNIVDVAPQKCLKVKGKGTIDILNREDTTVTYTVKASNLQGTLVDCYLIGPDANKFYGDGVSSGKVVVKVSENTTLSTKVTYKVVPVLVFENEEGWTYTIKADAQKIKVKKVRRAMLRQP